MKKLLLAVVVLLAISSNAQKSASNPAAKASFEKAYPSVKDAKWEKEDGNYEVSFTQNGKELSVIIDAKGKILETEQEMKASELSATITKYMETHYKGQVLKGAAKITKADGSIVYEAAIKGKDVLFDATGKFIKEVKD
jgi:Skp family chaperone for outer membrane proteins